jgi:SSS family solute:Na+ symporter
MLFNASFSPIDLFILILTYSVTFVVGPDIYSRVFCAKNEKTASRSILLVALILIPTSFALTYLGIYASETGSGIVAFAEHLLPGWAYGLFIAALLSAVMSSADTTLLTSSIIVSELITGNLNKRNSLKLTRYFILITGAASLLIALFVTSIIQALLLALTFFSGAFVVPTLAGLLKIKVNKKRVATAILIGGTTALTGKIMHTAGSELLGNTIIISSYILNAAILWNYRKPNTNSDQL